MELIKGYNLELKKEFSLMNSKIIPITTLGPCYGELGTGEKFRNQGVPKKSKEFEYANILKVKVVEFFFRLENIIR